MLGVGCKGVPVSSAVQIAGQREIRLLFGLHEDDDEDGMAF